MLIPLCMSSLAISAYFINELTLDLACYSLESGPRCTNVSCRSWKDLFGRTKNQEFFEIYGEICIPSDLHVGGNDLSSHLDARQRIFVSKSRSKNSSSGKRLDWA
ncbi:hypothetical protein ONS96_003798 [Cadophora gregata f. sp. sojae]|nr:hypothetical protein ONS96_003798 [Cadophora gregata f. sp. sojae]